MLLKIMGNFLEKNSLEKPYITLMRLMWLVNMWFTDSENKCSFVSKCLSVCVCVIIQALQLEMFIPDLMQICRKLRLLGSRD